jgi:hypothetical protein
MTDDLITALSIARQFVPNGTEAAERVDTAMRTALEAQIATVAPAVDAQPVAWRHKATKILRNDSIAKGADFEPDDWEPLYASPQSEGLRKDAEELLRRIPTTPEQMIDFIGSHFDSMQADGWTDTLPSKPTGDLSMVRYSLTVHDLLSAFDWADLSEYAIDAALSQQDPQ